MSSYVNKATLDRVNNLSILNYATSRGYETIKVGKSYKIPHLGGLYIDDEKNIFNNFATKKGGGIIQFVMLTESKSWKQAVDDLVDEYNIDTDKKRSQDEISKSISKQEKSTAKQDNIIEKKEVMLDEKDTTSKNVIAYLNKTRKIDMEYIQRALDEKKIYQSVKKSVVYKMYDENNNLVGASWESTNTIGTYKGQKGMVKGSQKTYPFEFTGTGQKLFVFESPIDMMSYQTLLKNKGKSDIAKEENFIANFGLSDTPLENYLKTHPNIKQIYFCYDNDVNGTAISNGKEIPCNHGQETAKRQMEKYKDKYECQILTPRLKDYNDELKAYVKEKEHEKVEAESQEEMLKKNEINEEKEAEKQIEENKIKEKSNQEHLEENIKESIEKENEAEELEEKEIPASDESLKKDMELTELIILQDKLKQESYGIIEKIDDMQTQLGELKVNYETTITKLLDTKEKIYQIQKDKMLDIIKNNAYTMIKSGMDLNIVNKATKVEMEQLKQMQKEIVENGTYEAYTIEPKIQIYDQMENKQYYQDEEDYIPILSAN